MKFWTPSMPTGGRPLRAQVGKTLQHALLKCLSPECTQTAQLGRKSVDAKYACGILMIGY